MRIPLLGQSDSRSSSNFNYQKTLNFYLEQAQDGRSALMLVNRPGQLDFATCGSGPIRGGQEFNGVGYVVSGDTFYTVTPGGTATNRGTLSTSSGRVYMAFNGTQVMVTDGSAGYIYTLATGVFAAIADADFVYYGPCTYINSYFIAVEPASGRAGQSAINDGTSWAALDVATAESSPDNLKAVLADHDELLMLGDKTIEPWYNDAGTDFSFTRYIGAQAEVGLAEPAAICKTDEGVFFLGDDLIFYRLQGRQPVRVSHHGVETALQGYASISGALCFTYDWKGHKFVHLTVPNEGTWVYDVSNGGWTENGTFDENDWKVACAFHLGQKAIVGSSVDGQLYELSDSTYTDDGGVLERLRRTQNIVQDQKLVFWNRLELVFESGVGLLSGQGSSPQVMLRWSEDGGHTWGTEIYQSLGATGEYGWRAVFDMLGASYQRIYEIRVTDPVKVILIDAFADVTVGRH
jgi:hypothetical protein